MASVTKTYTNAELLAVLQLGKVEKVTFTAAQIPTATATALATAYLNLLMNRTNAFPFGRTLQQFADAQIVIVKAAIAAV